MTSLKFSTTAVSSIPFDNYFYVTFFFNNTFHMNQFALYYY